MVKTYFVTASAYMQQNLFQRAETADLLLRTIFRYRDSSEFLVHEFVVMPNHIHLLLSVDDDHAIGRAMQMVKGGFSYALREAKLKAIAVWQPGYYERRVGYRGIWANASLHSAESGTPRAFANSRGIPVFVVGDGIPFGRSPREAKA